MSSANPTANSAPARSRASVVDATDTIAAIASPPGPAPRGMVRLSGSQARAIAATGFVAVGSKSVHDSKRPNWRVGTLQVPGLRPTVPARLLEWPGPQTYTGQEMAEIHTVGAAPVLGLVLSGLLKAGARAAGPGEFTLRAYLAGRIDLTRAEAVHDAIEARTADQLAEALTRLAGGISGPIERLHDRLLDALALLEAGLDFADESDVDPIGRLALADSVASAAAEVEALTNRLSARDRPTDRPRVVLAGPPNAGKSRLFNALLGRAAAIVSPRPGTTRDYLVADWDCEGRVVELVDTAGFEPASDPIAASAQAHRSQQASRSDVVLACRPADGAPGSWDDGLERDLKAIPVWTKADLAPAPDTGWIATSVEAGVGLDTLRSAVAARLRDSEGDAGGTASRCGESLRRASDALASAAESLMLPADCAIDELVAVDLRQALDDLGSVIGDHAPDEVLDRIFRRFCIGK